MSSRSAASGGEVGPLALDVSSDGDVVVVTVGGEIDAHTSPQLRACLIDQLGRDDRPTITVDLRSVSFCDSTALGVLVGTHRRLQGEGRRLEIRAPSASVRHLFEVSGLDRVLNVE